MSVKNDIEQLVALQGRELELLRIDRDLEQVAALRRKLQAEIDAARKVVKTAEDGLEAARAEARRLDLDLKTAEDQVVSHKDKVLAVKTNQELWALQEEIKHAEAAVGDVETRILEQMEKADELEAVIRERSIELEETEKRVDAGNVECDAKEAELDSERARVNEAIQELTARIPAELLRNYEDVKAVRHGVGVAEALDETCLVCNFRMRPQLYVEAFNLGEIMHCENCGRILYVAERIDVPASMRRRAEEPAAVPAEASAVVPAEAPAEVPAEASTVVSAEEPTEAPPAEVGAAGAAPDVAPR